MRARNTKIIIINKKNVPDCSLPVVVVVVDTLQRLLSWLSILFKNVVASSNGRDNSSLYLIKTSQYES